MEPRPTYIDFCLQYEGKAIDYDGAYGAQSPDLAAQYVEYMTGDPQVAGKSLRRNAIDWADPARCTELDGVADFHTEGTPEAGDLVVIRSSVPEGSIGVMVHEVGDGGRYTLFTQNPGPAQERAFTTEANPILGWWRFR